MARQQYNNAQPISLKYVGRDITSMKSSCSNDILHCASLQHPSFFNLCMSHATQHQCVDSKYIALSGVFIIHVL